MTDYTLITGATGLLGRYLLRDLLLAGQRLVVVARPQAQQSVVRRIESILQLWETQLGCELARPVCLAGDLGQETLGLDEKDRQWLARRCTRVLHSAAALKFQQEANGEPWLTNVTGTANVLQLCRDTNIRQLHYVSTAYVCGNREGRIYENELDLGQRFRNDYEASKLQAETLVRQDDSLEQVTVYRPAVIAGDSQTGYTNTYHGLFMYLQLMCVLARNTEPGPDGVRHTPLDLQITGDEPRNVIPVDWAAKVICHLFQNPRAHGRTYHLAPSQRMTAREMIEAGYTYFNSTGVNFVGPIPMEQQADGSLGHCAFENSGMYRDYEVSDPEFDTSNLRQFAGHLPCPAIDEEMLHRFMQYGELDRWGKRRLPSAQIPLEIGDFLEQALVCQENSKLAAISSTVSSTVAASSAEPGLSRATTIGLDLLGSGGGQWTISFNAHGLLAVEPGIATVDSSTLRITVAQFIALIGVQGGDEELPGDLSGRESQLRVALAEAYSTWIGAVELSGFISG